MIRVIITVKLQIKDMMKLAIDDNDGQNMSSINLKVEIWLVKLSNKNRAATSTTTFLSRLQKV